MFLYTFYHYHYQQFTQSHFPYYPKHMLQHVQLHLHNSLHSVHTFLLSMWAKPRIAFYPDSHNTNTTSPHPKIQSYLNISIKPITTYLCPEFLYFNSLQRIPKILIKLISCIKNMNYCGLTNYTLTHQSVSTLSLISNLQTYHSHSNTSTRQKIRIFWKIAITFLTLAQNPFNYSKRFNIILEINEGKLVHNYGNFNYKYMYFLKKNAFF